MNPKDMLRTGDVVEIRTGDRFIVISNINDEWEDVAFNPITKEHIKISQRKPDLSSCYGGKLYDIIKIYRPLYEYSLKQFDSSILFDDYFKLIWYKYNLQVGDKVKIINVDKVYPYFSKHLINDLELLGRFMYGHIPDDKVSYSIVLKDRIFEKNDVPIYTIANSQGQVYIISEEGLEKW